MLEDELKLEFALPQERTADQSRLAPKCTPVPGYITKHLTRRTITPPIPSKFAIAVLQPS